MDGWHGEPGTDGGPGFGQVDSLSSHPGRSDSLRRGNVIALVCVAALALAALTVLARDRHPDWPSGCGVEGHADWCAEPSRAMTGLALTRLVRDYCPSLSTSATADVVPRPLELADLGGRDAFAKTSGTRGAGAEDSLLGRGSDFSWVTRWTGGPENGVVELRCPGQSSRVPSLHLDQDQFRSTVAATRGHPGHINFAELAASSVRRVPGGFGVSFGFVTCDTARLDLRHLRPGTRFSCGIEVYYALGKGGYRLSYRVTGQQPYFAPTGSG